MPSRAREAAQAFFESAAREGMFWGSNFNGSVWEFQMRNRVQDDYQAAKDGDPTPNVETIILLVVSEDDRNL